MLKLVNVNKYFFRHKKNQIHVINNTSLELPDKGLIALLGESGCGKTTLLNAIGGLDKIDSGKMYLDGKYIPKGNSYKKDKMRVLNIGYIFQDYRLLEHLSVYENIFLSLRMIGIKDKNELKRRTDYVLNKVGMYRYRNKPAGMLSGGEKQRVAIARAIVKNPSIIIADEPTGNLDSKNTIEIMNIIKSISKDKLVILVTHEKTLAEFYATRIISLEDGSIISDKGNLHRDELDYRIDNKIYLKDIKNYEEINNEDNKLKIYKEDDEKLDLCIVVRGNNIYIKNNKNTKMEIIDENSNIELVNEHYKKITRDDYEKTGFDLNELDNSKLPIRYSSIYSISSMFKTGFNTVKNYKLVKKLLLFGFFFAAMFIVFAISNIFGSTKVNDSDFMDVDRNYVLVKNAGNKLKDYLNLENNFEFMIPGSSKAHFTIRNKEIYQFSYADINFSASIVPSKFLKDVKYGRMPENNKEVVIDYMVANNCIKNENFIMANMTKIEDLLNKNIEIYNIGIFKIVGISDNNTPSIYFDENIITDVISVVYEKSYSDATFLNYKLEDKIELKEGRMPDNDYEIIVNMNMKETMPLNKTIEYNVGGNKLKVVGYYTSNYVRKYFYTNENTIKYTNITKNSDYSIYTTNKDKTIEYLHSKGINAIDVYEQAKKEHIDNKKQSVTESLIVAGILLVISFVEIYLMVRASFLSRIKEVGIYRAVGVKKMDIYKMFLGEILVITTIASFPGYILMSRILNEISKIEFIGSMFIVDARVLIISIIIIYGLNILMGLLPVTLVTCKTPAQILSRNDVD